MNRHHEPVLTYADDALTRVAHEYIHENEGCATEARLSLDVSTTMTVKETSNIIISNGKNRREGSFIGVLRA